MDNKSIGEYLKRLRLRAGYKQSELGEILSVTDKAISRWESGLGTPEIGNLMAIAKIYDITVDDILNCNEEIFSSALSACGDGVSAREVAVPKEGGVKKTFNSPQRKFLSVIFFAYIIFGIYVTDFHLGEVTALSAFYIIYSVSILAIAAVTALSFKLPENVYKIVIIALDALCVLCGFAIMITFSSLTASEQISSPEGSVSAFCGAFFAVMFAIQLVYTLSEFVRDDKKLKILNLCAMAFAATALLLAIICTGVNGIWLESEAEERIFEPINVAFIISAAAAFCFTVGQLTNKTVNVLTAILIFAGGAVGLFGYMFAAQYLLASSPVQAAFYFTPMFIAFACVAPFSSVVGWLFEGSKRYLAAMHITSVISALILIPFIVYTFDMLAIDLYFKKTLLSASQFMKIAMFIGLFVQYFVDFKIVGLIRSLSERRKKH